MKRKCLLPCTLLLALLLPAVLNACTPKKIYTDDLPAEELAGMVCAALPETGFLTAREDYLGDYLPLSGMSGELCVRFAAEGNDLDEFGIWHVKSGDAGAACALLRNYLEDSLQKNRSFYDSYIPEETPKLRDAEARVYGNYAVYAILNDKDRRTFFETVERALASP